MSLQSPVIGYTLGDQAGIGPEIIRKALAQLPRDAEYRLMGAEIAATPGKPDTHTEDPEADAKKVSDEEEKEQAAEAVAEEAALENE